MKNSTLLLLCSLLLSCFTVNAQPPCGFDEIHQQLLATDPAYARRIEETNRSIRQFIENHPELRTQSQQRTTALYTIPVVVHVMHTGGAVGTIYNPSDAQIMGAINYLNQVFDGSHPSMTPYSAGGAAGNIDIAFALAQRTPSCGNTNGIDRVDASSLTNYTAFGVNRQTSNGVTDLDLKNFSRWDPSSYYNIWIVNKIDGADGTAGQFIAGYAYFAGAAPEVDGTVMLATQMVAGEGTLAHEIGHALNLYHTFEGSANNTQCPANSNCTTQGDRICDTDPITNNYDAGTGFYDFSCRTGNNGCTGTPYTINTENNIMSYTNCFTLFTNDQKARMQAAMSLPSRSSLVSGSNMALVPCGTVINFNVASATQSESTTGTTGCRNYTDYNFQMTVGAAISATATATLTFSGTGIKGLDYEVTTNGNFAFPSNVLTFNAGSTTAQSFTVRIFNDANVESSETAIIDFALNNGGGNATKGTAFPTLTFTINDNDQAPAGSGSGTTGQIGTSAGSVNAVPFDARQQSMRCQLLYRASELTAAGVPAGNITALQLYISSKTSLRNFSGFTIRMGHTGLNYLINGSVNEATGLTAVYTNASQSTAANWNNFNLSTPFTWDGTSNIAIEICYNNAAVDGAAGQDAILVYADGGAGQGNMFYQNGINCAGSFSTVSYYSYKPLIRFSYATSGTAIETVAGATRSDHIDVGSNDYLYSNNSRLMVRVGNTNASLGCVTSTIDAGGTTWVNFLGGQRSAKVFNVTPTSNGATATYTIALYFENVELGGKTASTLRIAKTSAASAGAANAGNTVVVVPTVTTLGSGTTVFTATFTGFSRFFLIDNAVGLITLPVELTAFTARINNDKNTVLNWVTASEHDNKQFDIEVSKDGVNFTSIGSVASKGNSITQQHYEYLHIKPTYGVNYYRFKQVDLDGRFVYSRIVSVNIDNGIVKAFLFPVPAREVVTVNFGSLLNNGLIEIFSSDMKMLRQEQINNLSARKDLNVSSLPAGVYFVRLSHGATVEVMRFVKE